jgi:hypothetical protein
MANLCFYLHISRVPSVSRMLSVPLLLHPSPLSHTYTPVHAHLPKCTPSSPSAFSKSLWMVVACCFCDINVANVCPLALGGAGTRCLLPPLFIHLRHPFDYECYTVSPTHTHTHVHTHAYTARPELDLHRLRLVDRSSLPPSPRPLYAFSHDTPLAQPFSYSSCSSCTLSHTCCIRSLSPICVSLPNFFLVAHCKKCARL